MTSIEIPSSKTVFLFRVCFRSNKGTFKVPIYPKTTQKQLVLEIVRQSDIPFSRLIIIRHGRRFFIEPKNVPISKDMLDVFRKTKFFNVVEKVDPAHIEPKIRGPWWLWRPALSR